MADKLDPFTTGKFSTATEKPGNYTERPSLSGANNGNAQKSQRLQSNGENKGMW